MLGALVLRKHVLKVQHHFFHAGAGKHVGEGLAAFAGVDFDHPIGQLAVPQKLAQVLAGTRLERHRLAARTR